MKARGNAPSAVAAVGLLGCALIVVGCGPEPLDFADWTIPVSEETPVREYADVPDEDRVGNRIALERDLVIGDSGAPEETFYQPVGLAVDGDGRIYVLERGNHRVQVFDAEGEFLLSFGAEGQGPGEFSSPVGIGVVGGHVLVTDRTNSRVSVYSRSGEHIEDRSLDRNDVFSQFVGLDDGSLLVSKYPSIPLGVEDLPPVYWSATRRAQDGSVLMEYLSLPFGVGTIAQQTLEGGRRRFISVPMRSPRPLAVLDPSGHVYATAGDHYQVLALDEEGQQQWALRVARAVSAPTEEEIEAVLASLRERYDTLRRDEVSWPEQYPAIQALRIDGAGNLYVFPHVFHAPALEGDEEFDGPYPVDVYDADGRRVFAGTIDVVNWSTALGEHIYVRETDPATGEPIFVRYRIITEY